MSTSYKDKDVFLSPWEKMKSLARTQTYRLTGREGQVIESAELTKEGIKEYYLHALELQQGLTD